MRKRLSLLVLAVLPATGCSFLFVTRVPADSARAPIVDCSASYSGPVADTLLAALFAVGAVTNFVHAEPPNATVPKPVRVGVNLGLLGLFTTSAASGYQKVGRCRDTLEGHAPFDYRPEPAPVERRAEQKADEAAEEAAVQAARARAAAAEQAKAAGEAAHSATGGKPAPGGGPSP